MSSSRPSPLSAPNNSQQAKGSKKVSFAPGTFSEDKEYRTDDQYYRRHSQYQPGTYADTTGLGYEDTSTPAQMTTSDAPAPPPAHQATDSRTHMEMQRLERERDEETKRNTSANRDIPEPDTFECMECSQKFSASGDLEAHMAEAHAELEDEMDMYVV